MGKVVPVPHSTSLLHAQAASLGRKLRARERENLLQSSHISLWEHSSHFMLIGRSVPSVSCFSASVQFSLFGLLTLPQADMPHRLSGCQAWQRNRKESQGPYLVRSTARLPALMMVVAATATAIRVPVWGHLHRIISGVLYIWPPLGFVRGLPIGMCVYKAQGTGGGGGGVHQTAPTTNFTTSKLMVMGAICMKMMLS